MTETPALEFWFEFASTYSYPAAMRVERLCHEAGVALVWKPFLLGPVFKRFGMSDSPFNLNQAKGAYMWRDMERICAEQGLAFRKPSAFPRGSLLAARVVCAHPDAPWLGDFIRAVYEANFTRDAEIGTPQVVADCLRACGTDPAPALAAADSDPAKSALRAQTDAALAKGIFGAPTCIVGGELFWGNDRLDAAVMHATGAGQAPAARP